MFIDGVDCSLGAPHTTSVRSHIGGGTSGCVGRSDCVQPLLRSQIGGGNFGCFGRSDFLGPFSRSHIGGGNTGGVGRSDCLHPLAGSHMGRTSKSKSTFCIEERTELWCSCFSFSFSKFMVFRDSRVSWQTTTRFINSQPSVEALSCFK